MIGERSNVPLRTSDYNVKEEDRIATNSIETKSKRN